ncbi:MAG: hypothetical protein LBL75_01520 [Rickettsiales bacterium]|jgi:hypothetical protein|nr:hypothetical protein [Rickettsiales bacterium]
MKMIKRIFNKTCVLLSVFCVVFPAMSANSGEDYQDSHIRNVNLEATTITKKGLSFEKINTSQQTMISNVANDLGAQGTSPTEIINNMPELPTTTKREVVVSDKDSLYNINKLDNSIATAATGLGAMNLAQGLGEQKQDDKADARMSGYLAGLSCPYPGGSAKFNDRGVAIAATDLALQREEYAMRALELKTLKEQMNKLPGLESEIEIGDIVYAPDGSVSSARIITDSGTLYDNQAMVAGDKTSAFGSLSQAQLNADGRDAQLIAAQRDTSKDKVVGGTIAVVGGAAVALGGQALIDKVMDGKNYNVSIENVTKPITGEITQITQQKKSDGQKVVVAVETRKSGSVATIPFQNIQNQLGINPGANIVDIYNNSKRAQIAQQLCDNKIDDLIRSNNYSDKSNWAETDRQTLFECMDCMNANGVGYSQLVSCVLDPDNNDEPISTFAALLCEDRSNELQYIKYKGGKLSDELESELYECNICYSAGGVGYSETEPCKKN